MIVAGQVLLSCLAGYGFSKFRFRGKEALFFLVILLMMMPYQVTLVSNYLMLDRLGLVGSYWALILPAMFSPFGVFLLRQVFDTCPQRHPGGGPGWTGPGTCGSSSASWFPGAGRA